MEQISKEKCNEKLLKLGTAMFSLFDGKKLSAEQIEIIKEATDKQKVLAMEIVAFSTLNGQSYTNYCQNKRKIIRK